MTDFDSPLTLSPGETQAAFSIECDAAKMKHDLAENKQIFQVNALTLHTNASTYLMELTSFNGHLSVSCFWLLITYLFNRPDFPVSYTKHQS